MNGLRKFQINADCNACGKPRRRRISSWGQTMQLEVVELVTLLWLDLNEIWDVE